MPKQKSFFNEHFAAIITGVVSISAVIVSLIQLKVTSLDKEKELAINKQNAIEARRLDEIRANRVWMLDVANYLTNHRQEIYSEGESKRQIEKIILATFPAEITSKVFENLYDVSENKDEWQNAKAAAFSLERPSTKIFYEKDFPSELIDTIGDTLAEGDISYPFEDHVIPVGLTNGDVRYFSEKDKELAIQVKNDFEQLACFDNYILKLELISLVESKVEKPLGYVEVWLPKKAIVKSKRERKC